VAALCELLIRKRDREILRRKGKEERRGDNRVSIRKRRGTQRKEDLAHLIGEIIQGGNLRTPHKKRRRGSPRERAKAGDEFGTIIGKKTIVYRMSC